MNSSILAILLIWNIFVLTLVWSDKVKSRKDLPRHPEVYFFVWATFLGALGVLCGMVLFRHKVRKWYFALGMPLLLLQNIALVFAIMDVLNA